MDFENATTDYLRMIILGSMAFTAFLCVLLFCFQPVKNVLVFNPVWEKMVRWIAYASVIFMVLGILCIFWEAVRIPTVIALGFYFMFFLCVCVISRMCESIDYWSHKNDTPVLKECTITKHKIEATNQGQTYYLNLVFDGESRECEFSENTKPLLFFDHVKEGDRAQAEYIQGALGLRYIVSLRQMTE